MGLTRLQVAELSQRSHLQMLQVERISLSARQIPHHVLVDHADASELHQRSEQQRHLGGITVMQHSVDNDAPTKL